MIKVIDLKQKKFNQRRKRKEKDFYLLNICLSTMTRSWSCFWTWSSFFWSRWTLRSGTWTTSRTVSISSWSTTFGSTTISKYIYFLSEIKLWTKAKIFYPPLRRDECPFLCRLGLRLLEPDLKSLFIILIVFSLKNIFQIQ
jgi:hypothetical protein